jgi:hypothetical protein
MNRPSVIPRQPVIEFSAGHRGTDTLPSLLDLRHRLMTRSGRSAIVLALAELGVGRGDRVLVPTYHCPTMIAPVERLGAIPVFYPVTADGLPDIAYLQDHCREPCRAMLAAHFFGRPASLRTTGEFCRSRGMFLIEDCAHCFFGEAGDAPVGATGDFAIGSLPKFFPVVEGGILASASRAVTGSGLPRGGLRGEVRAAWNMLDLAARAQRLGVLGAAARAVSAARHAGRPTGEAAGHAEPSAAAIREEGLADPLLVPARLSRTESWVVERSRIAALIARRRRNYLELSQGLEDLNEAPAAIADCGLRSAPYVLPLLVADADDAYLRMRGMGLPVFRWDRLWPGTPDIPGDATRIWARGMIQVACHQSLRLDDVAQMLAGIRQSLRHR